MKLFLALLIAVFSVSALAGEVVLLTSLKLNKLNIRYLENKFRKTFRNSGHELVIHHRAGPKTLYEVMTSEKTEAVIWVSHAAREENLQPGFKAQEAILDDYGNDVKNFFTLARPGLKFLGLVGCQAKSILDGFRARGNFESSPDLEIMSFEKKVRLYPAFNQTLKTAAASLKSPRNSEVKERDVIEFQIERSDFSHSPGLAPSWVEMGDQILAFFDRDETSAPIHSLDKIVFDKITRKNIKFFRVKSQEHSEDNMGQLAIIPSAPIGRWSLFAKDGKPIGGPNQHLYIFKQELPKN